MDEAKKVWIIMELTLRLSKILRDLRILDDDKIQLQPYVEGTGDHGITRTGQEKLYYADLLSLLVYLQKFGRLPRFSPWGHFLRSISCHQIGVLWATSNILIV